MCNLCVTICVHSLFVSDPDANKLFDHTGSNSCVSFSLAKKLPSFQIREHIDQDYIDIQNIQNLYFLVFHFHLNAAYICGSVKSWQCEISRARGSCHMHLQHFWGKIFTVIENSLSRRWCKKFELLLEGKESEELKATQSSCHYLNGTNIDSTFSANPVPRGAEVTNKSQYGTNCVVHIRRRRKPITFTRMASCCYILQLNRGDTDLVWMQRWKKSRKPCRYFMLGIEERRRCVCV